MFDAKRCMSIGVKLVLAVSLMCLTLGAAWGQTSTSPKKQDAKSKMNETDAYILDSIRTWVWSGFYSAKEVDEMIDDILEEDADEAMLRAAVGPEFEKKKKAEAQWPKVTDFDRLETAFAALDRRGVLCLHNAGYTMSDGDGDVADALSQQPKDKYWGYCFYHGQDMERAIEGHGVMLAFGDTKGQDAAVVKAGRAIEEELKRAGFAVVWNGTGTQRIDIPKFDWKHRAKR